MQDYRILKYLGDGGFASVHLTQHRKLGKVAYKKFAALNLPDSDWTQIRKEAKIQMRLRHPNVVSMFEAQFTSPDIGLFLEYMQYGSVDSFIREYTVTWEWKTQILYDVSLAMAYLHRHKPVIIHGDLKSQNILIGDGYRAKISDFGLSRTIQTLSSVEVKVKLRGTIEYIAPEYLDDPYRKKTEKFDVYGYGITAWEIYSQKSFFKTFFDKRIIGVQVGNGKRPEMVDIRDNIPASITELMTQCWQQEHDGRPSFETIRDRLFSQISSNLFALQLPSKTKRPKHDMEDSSCQHPIDQADFISSGIHEQSRAESKFITGLKKVQSSIAEHLDPFNGLLVCLRERGILERDENDKLNQFVNETTSHRECNERILSEYVLPKIEYCCKEFIEALKDNDQEHIVNFIMNAGEHLDRVLSKEEIRIIDDNKSCLVNLIDPYKMGFLDLLVSENCITSRQREIVEKRGTNQEKIVELMKVLKLRNCRHFQNFKLCLNETKQGKLADVLVEGQGVIAVHVTIDKNKNISTSKLIAILTTHLQELDELDGSPTMEQITLKNQLNELTGLGVDFIGVCNSADESIVNYFQCSSSRSVKKFSQALESGQLKHILENMYRCHLQIPDTKSTLIKHVTSDTNISHVKHPDNRSRTPGESNAICLSVKMYGFWLHNRA